MDSAMLAQYAFKEYSWRLGEWLPVAESTKADLLTKVPLQHGVFVLRSLKQWQYKKKPSDLVYMGASTTSHNLRDHLKKYFRKPRGSLRTWSRMMRSGEPLELAWIATNSSRDALVLKRELLFWFYNRCGELPRWNRQAQLITLQR